MTHSAKRFIIFSVRVSCCATLLGNKVATAGRKKIEKKNAAITPIAATLPKSRNGGASLKLSDKKPIAVVIDVKNTGIKLSRKLSCMARCFSTPLRISDSHVDKICTLSATAKVIIITGADITGADNSIPIQPLKPNAVMTEKTITSKVTKVAVILRNNKNTVIKINNIAKGNRFAISDLAASPKALFIITMPDIYTVKSG